MAHYFFNKQISLITFLLLFIFSTQASKAESHDLKVIRLATTTSTENSGLLHYLLPEFEKDSGYKVHTIAVGTGKALRMGRDGDVDILLVHALSAEEKFITDGHGVKRFPVMMNDFIIVGSKHDPAQIKASKNVEEALEKIASHEEKFISRGDDSGTNKKEINLWSSSTKKNPNWYLEAGQGMGKVLQMAGEMDAYTMTDRGTWLAYESKSPLKITFEGDPKLFNPYGIIAVNPKKYPDLNNTGANALIKWITSDKGQKMIGDFKISGKVLFKPTSNTLEAQ